MERYAILGDVHGDLRRLDEALEMLLALDRKIIMVGDYINRGPNGRMVLDRLMELRSLASSSVFLRGNHEDALIRYLEDRSQLNRFLRHGGLATMKTYLDAAVEAPSFEAFRRIFPLSHRTLLQDMPSYFEVPGLLVSHVGVDPARPNVRDAQTMVCTPHPDLFLPATLDRLPPGVTYVFGHYVQRSGRPYDAGRIVCIDTGCGTIAGGRLTAMLFPEHTFLQF